jgi:hypothetical protein
VFDDGGTAAAACVEDVVLESEADASAIVAVGNSWVVEDVPLVRPFGDNLGAK